MPTIALLCPESIAAMVFEPRHWERLAALGTVVDARFGEDRAQAIAKLADADLIVSSWGMPKMDDAFLAAAPRVKAVFYAAGTIKGFVTPASYARGIAVSSAAPANAVPVAEYTVGVILLSNKRFWEFMRHTRREVKPAHPIPGNYRRTVGIIGASMVGRDTMRLLQPYDMDILLFDPFVSAEEAAELGARKVDLPTLMAESDIVSLHAPNLPELAKMINGDLLARMKDGATFINTARGALVDEDALRAELQSGRIYAVLDVTDPEPPVEGSPFYTLPNCVYTPHIAGSMDPECARMADFAIDELERYLNAQPMLNSVSEAQLARMA